MQKYPIPNFLNLCIICISTVTAITLLILASRTHSVWLILLYAIFFSFVNNTNFSLLHEAVHDILNKNSRINYILGVFLAALFPTGFSFQRYFHLGHHQRNRSYSEQFDYYRPEDSIYIRYLQWYGILTGLYWVTAPLCTLLYLVMPSLIPKMIHHSKQSHFANYTGLDEMLKSVDRAPSTRARGEILFTLLFQFSLFYFLGITWIGWLSCYGAFAINWSSLQYADHAWSKLNAIEGAWNLQVHPIVRTIYLDYHHHHAHHKNPKISWIHLKNFVDNNEPRPWFYKIYIQMWKGPRPIEDHLMMYQKVIKECC
jgi:fatty acid desaturase